MQPCRPLIHGPDFTAVFEREFAYVWHTLRRLGIDDSDIEDMAHEVFFQVYRQFDNYDGSRPIRPWLFGFAYRLASDYRKRARRKFEILDNRERGDAAGGAEHLLIRAEQWALLQTALDGIPLERRAVLVLHDIEGHTMPEIAAVLAVPLSTAYTRLRLAREDFARIVKRLRIQRGFHGEG